MSAVARAWRAWVALMDTREPATPLALCRIAIGLVIVGHLTHMMVTGADALVWLDAAHGGLRVLDGGPLLRPLGGATPFNLRALETVATVSGLALSAGAFTRVAAVLAWLSWRVLANLNGHAGGSYDEVVTNTLFLLMLSGAGNALSVDAYRRGARSDALAWPRWVGVGQIVVVYWSTGLQKVSAGWIPGGPMDALWYILQQPSWHRVDMAWLAPLFPLTQAATLGTWLFEMTPPLLLLSFWFRRTRTRGGYLRAQFNRIDFRFWYLAVGVVLHVSIEAALEVGPFSFAMLSLYPLAFHGDELARLTTRPS